MTCPRNKLVQTTTRFFSGTIVAALAVTLLTSQTANAQNIYWTPSSGTSSWFAVSNWNTSTGGSGSSYLPTATNYANLNSGTCVIDAGSNAVAERIANYQYWQGGTSYTLDIELGATLTVSTHFRLGNERVDGTVNVRGTLDVIDAVNQGFVLGGYTLNTATNNRGVLNIDGGLVTFGKGTIDQAMLIGGASTGLVEITNGGCLHTIGDVYMGTGETIQSDGTVIIQDGVWTNERYLIMGRTRNDSIDLAPGNAKIIINGGALHSTLVGDPCIDIGNSGNGRFVINGGEFVGRSAFNNTNANAPRAMISLGSQVGGTGIFIQNGGTVTAVGLRIGKLGSGTAIISNGTFNAMSSNGSWPLFEINDGDKLTIDGGSFLAYTNTSGGYIRSGGILELRDGILDLGECALYTESNATVRLIGPLADTTLWWRHNSADPSNAVMELVLTKDAGHISRLKSQRSFATAVPGTLRTGIEGGACLLSTNSFAYLWASNGFDNDRAQVSNYNLDLWDVSEDWLGVGNGEEHRIALKPAASQGAVNIPGTVSFAGTAYGYIDISDLNSGTLPQMQVDIAITTAAKTAADIVQDLQDAGYTNSALVNANTISMAIPESYITTDSAHFTWDFRDFDGTVNATVTSVSFKFSPEGTMILLR